MEKKQLNEPPPAYTSSSTFPGGKEGDAAGPPQQPLTQQPPGYAYPQQQGGYPQQVHYQPVVMTQPVTVAQPFEGIPPNHSTLAWLTCLFCCWPLGLLAIIKSREVDSAADRGDLVAANHASRSARKFGYCSLGFGIGSYVIAVIILVVYFVVLLPMWFSGLKGISSIYDE